MKRHGKLFEKLVDIENIHNAYKAAKKGKSWQDTIKKFDKNLESNLLEIQKSLIDKTLTTSEYTLKTIHEPKKRIIYRLPFNPDRIVQHVLMNVLEPIWEGLFIHDSYACRKGKGIHKASQRTMQFIREVGAEGYCLKMDISKFYPSMNHDILYGIIQRKIKCKDTLWLIRNIIYSMDGGKNVPIGNYTSQWFGNLYMNEIDQYLKHEHKIRHYLRYCDDFLVIHEDKKYLSELAEIIREYIAEKLKLTFSKCNVFPITQGIDFVGYRHFPNHILVRKSTTKRVRRRMKALPELLHKGKITELQYQSSIASTMGWLKWANSHNLQEALGIEQMWGEIRNG